MKILLILSLSFFVLSVASFTAQADDAVDHYEAQSFDNKKDAKRALKETTRKMAHIAASETLDIAKMEEIHQISYTTENAVKYLNKKGKLDRLADRLEEVHISSEDHEADNIRRYFILYQAELAHSFLFK